VHVGFLRIHQFFARINSGRIEAWKSLKEGGGLKSPHGNKLRNVDTESFGEKSSSTSTDARDSWRRKC
jgi:hypothetical protein